MKLHWFDYASRKFLLALAALAGAFALAWTGRDVSGFNGTVAAVLAFYNGAAVAIEYYRSKNGTQPTPGPITPTGSN